MIMRTAFLLLTALLVLLCQALSSGPIQKNRVIVLTDIEADPDDTQSMVRLLLYSNVIDIKGLIATTSTHMRNQVHPESIEKVIRAYGKVKANLAKHEAGYPEAETLLRLVKRGLLEYGMKGIGEGFVWFQYPEAGPYTELMKINGAENIARLCITAPEVKQRETVHFILKVTDKGSPPLSRYKRVIVNLMPKQNG